MLNIQSLTGEIQRLSESLAWWNKWGVIVGMAATAIAASWLVIAQLMVINESRAISIAQDELLRIKDEKLARDLSEKDLLIAEANKASAEAKLALERLKLPRSLTAEQRRVLIEAMRRFAGTVFEISGRENEALGFGLGLTDALVEAGWKVRTWTGGGEVINLPGRSFKAGAVIDDGIHLRTFSKELQAPREGFAKFLKDAGFNGVKESTIELGADLLKRNEMQIIIGPKI